MIANLLLALVMQNSVANAQVSPAADRLAPRILQSCAATKLGQETALAAWSNQESPSLRKNLILNKIECIYLIAEDVLGGGAKPVASLLPAYRALMDQFALTEKILESHYDVDLLKTMCPKSVQLTPEDACVKSNFPQGLDELLTLAALREVRMPSALPNNPQTLTLDQFRLAHENLINK